MISEQDEPTEWACSKCLEVECKCCKHELVAAEQRITELESALRGASRYTWIGEIDQPGSCFFCGHGRMFHGREGTIAETSNCIQTKNAERK